MTTIVLDRQNSSRFESVHDRAEIRGDDGRVLGVFKQGRIMEDSSLVEEKDEMTELYDQLATASAERILRPNDQYLKDLVTTLFKRLRELQQDEARRIRSRLEASLSMPIDAGTRALQEAKVLIKKYDNTSSDTNATEATDRSSP